MTPFQRLGQIEERLEQAFRKNRFDTFNQLLSERLVLLKRARQAPDGEALFATARAQTERWSERLATRIDTARRNRAEAKSPGGYGSASTRPGRVLNRAL